MRQDEMKVTKTLADQPTRNARGQLYHDAGHFRSELMAQMGRSLTRRLRRG